MKTRIAIAELMLAFAVLHATGLKAQDGLRGALSRGDCLAHIAIADFDHDQKPDGAILREAQRDNGIRSFRIELHLSAERNTKITVLSSDSGLSISALDVDRDGALDIVIEEAFSGQRLQVYLNDGHGSFHRARVEAHPSLDWDLRYWRARQGQDLSAFCLPSSCSSEIGRQQLVSTLGRERSAQLSFWSQAILLQSSVRALSAPRAPPDLLSL